MDWITGIQNAINYIEEHLTEEIDYEIVAKEASCSSFYLPKDIQYFVWNDSWRLYTQQTAHTCWQ